MGVVLVGWWLVGPGVEPGGVSQSAEISIGDSKGWSAVISDRADDWLFGFF
jgi:hypothetical protein